MGYISIFHRHLSFQLASTPGSTPLVPNYCRETCSFWITNWQRCRDRLVVEVSVVCRIPLAEEMAIEWDVARSIVDGGPVASSQSHHQVLEAAALETVVVATWAALPRGPLQNG